MWLRQSTGSPDAKITQLAQMICEQISCSCRDKVQAAIMPAKKAKKNLTLAKADPQSEHVNNSCTFDQEFKDELHAFILGQL